MLDWSKRWHWPLVCSLTFKSTNLSVCSYSYCHVYQIHLYYVVGAGNGEHGSYHGFRLLEWHKYLSISHQKCVELGDLRIVTLLGDWISYLCHRCLIISLSHSCNYTINFFNLLADMLIISFAHSNLYCWVFKHYYYVNAK